MKNLKKEIRKTLVETKRNKENKIIESKIVKSRLKAILESTPDFKSFKKLPFERQIIRWVSSSLAAKSVE